MTVRQEPAVSAFTLTPAQQALAEEVRELAAKELQPVAEDGEPGRVNRDLIRVMSRLGLLSRLLPGAAGQGSPVVPAMELCLVWEALATESTAAATALVAQGAGAYPVAEFGQAGQSRCWLPSVMAGEAVPAFAISGPPQHAGSPHPAIGLTAEPDGDGWRLTGEHAWVCNAPDADFYTVLARMAPGSGDAGPSVFLVPAIRPGLSGERLDVTAEHPVGCLTFDRVPVVRDDLLGEPGQGHLIAARRRAAFGPSAGALALGMARRAVEIAAAQAAAAGPPGARGGRQSTTGLLAEMATRTQAARLLVYAAAAASDAAGEPALSQGAMATVYATQTAQFVVDAAVQVVGADSLRRGHPLERLSREARAAHLYQGPADLQYGIIASELTG